MTKQIQILLIDDDSELQKTARECLKVQGDYNIDLVSSAENAFENMIQKKYDVVICDINMPVMDGFAFLKELRKGGNLIPFIVFTVTEDKQTALNAFRLGANGFVGKYGKPEVVFSTLKRCIDDLVIAQKNM